MEEYCYIKKYSNKATNIWLSVLNFYTVYLGNGRRKGAAAGTGEVFQKVL